MSSGKSFIPNHGNNNNQPPQQQRPAGNPGFNAYSSVSYNPATSNSYNYYGQPVYGYNQQAYGTTYMNNGAMYASEIQGVRPGVVPASTVKPVSSVSAAKSAEDIEAEKKKQEFKNQLLEKAKAQKEALAKKKAAAAAAATTAAAAATTAAAAAAPEPIKVEEVKKEEPVKAQEAAPKVEETPKAVEPEVEALNTAEAEEPKPALKKTEESKEAIVAPAISEKPKDAAAPVSVPVTTEATVGNAAAAPNTGAPRLESKYAHILEQTIEEPAFSNSVPNYADLVPKFAELKLVENPNEFNYEKPLTKPDEKLLERGPLLRYDPVFLNQFSHLKFDAGEAFQNRLLFVIKSIHERPAPKNNSGRGGFGQGSIGGYNKSNQSLRRLDSRSNSRQGSKRKPQNNRSERKSNRRGPSDRHHNEEREKEPEVPAEPVKPLEKSANRWVPKSRQSKTEEVKYAPDGVTVILPIEDVKKKVKSQLNKLTLEYFDPITDEIIKIAEQSKWEEDAITFKTVIDSIFDKAVDEPHWSSMYAKFCAKIFNSISEEVKDNTTLDAKGEPLFGSILFRKYLLTKCQVEYEKGWVDKLPTNEDGTPIEPELMSDEYYQIATAKRRGLGLVKFFGQLYVLNLLGENIIFYCLSSQSKNIEDPSDDTVENLIQLVKTVGPKLDHSPARSKFDTILAKIATLSKNNKIPSRLQFHLLDVLDSRKAGWAGTEEAGPKTISEIHAEESKKQQNEQREKLEKRRQKGNDSRQNSGRGQWSNNRVSDSDFQRAGQVSTPSQSSGPTNNFQRGKSSRGNNNNNNNSRLGSNSFTNLNKSQVPSPLANVSSSSANTQGLGSRENSKRPLNAFSALEDASDDDEEEEEEVEEEEDNSTINEDSHKEQSSTETAETSTSQETTKE